MTSIAPVVVLIADDDPADPMLSLAFQQANNHHTAVTALQYRPDADGRGLATRERWLFDRLAFYQRQYPDLYAVAESIDRPAQVTARSQSALVTIVGQRWLARHRRWQRQQSANRTSPLAIVSQRASTQRQ